MRTVFFCVDCQTKNEDNVYVTAEDGGVTFTTDGDRLWVDTER